MENLVSFESHHDEGPMLLRAFLIYTISVLQCPCQVSQVANRWIMYFLTAYLTQSAKFVCCVDISSICIASSPKAPVVHSNNGPQSALSFSISIIHATKWNSDEMSGSLTSQIYMALGRVSIFKQSIPNFCLREHRLCMLWSLCRWLLPW